MRLREIHLASREPFAEIGRTEFSLLPSVSDELLARGTDEGGLIVAVDAGGPLGFGLCERIGGYSHLQQLSVTPRRSRCGIGSAILCGLLELSGRRGDEAMTLITYYDIAWNRPFYERRGFSEVGAGHAPGHLLDFLAGERALGIDISWRTMMLRPLTGIALR